MIHLSLTLDRQPGPVLAPFAGQRTGLAGPSGQERLAHG